MQRNAKRDLIWISEPRPFADPEGRHKCNLRSSESCRISKLVKSILTALADSAVSRDHLNKNNQRLGRRKIDQQSDQEDFVRLNLEANATSQFLVV